MLEHLNATSCPLCDLQPLYQGPSRRGGRSIDVECERCGRFNVSTNALDYLFTEEIRPKRYLLSAASRNWGGTELLEIMTSNIESLFRQAPQFSVSEALDRLLLLIANTTQHLNVGSTFSASSDYPLLAFRDTTEATTYVYLLREAGWIQPIHADTALRLTVRGWERISELQKVGPTSRNAFVAMNFDKSFDPLYQEVILPAIQAAKYAPIRVDQTQHTNRIDDEIMAQIRRSRFMVADFTGQRQGVYFEAGMMLGLGRRVIWMCEAKEIEEKKPHFDVRQYFFIPWEYSAFADARKRLTDRIVALEGEGS